MLLKTQRLNLKKEFNFVSQGKRVETPSLKLMMKTGDNKVPLVGVALVKKNFHKAVARNKAKRKASDAIQLLYKKLRKDLNLVIMPKVQILEKSVDELKGELENVKDLYPGN